MKPSEVLAKAADLIEPEGAWTQGKFAREASGLAQDPKSPKAICWCARGAIIRSGGLESAPLRYLRSVVPSCDRSGEPVAVWNDAPERTQAEVVKALRDAADLARSEGQ